MRVLVIYAHPVESSFHAAMHLRVVAALRKAGHEVDDCDLYAEGFNPVLSREERLNYHDTSINQLPVKPYVERLQRADALVFCFPVWCFGLPAILKGWFDRVLMPGVSFDISDPAHVKPALTHLKRMVDEISARPAAQKALTLKDRHQFKAEMDDVAKKAMFGHLSEKVA